MLAIIIRTDLIRELEKYQTENFQILAQEQSRRNHFCLACIIIITGTSVNDVLYTFYFSHHKKRVGKTLSMDH